MNRDTECDDCDYQRGFHDGLRMVDLEAEKRLFTGFMTTLIVALVICFVAGVLTGVVSCSS